LRQPLDAFARSFGRRVPVIGIGTRRFTGAPPRAPEGAIMTRTIRLARSLAPEEVRAGDYVAVLHEFCELIPFMCAESSVLERGEPYRFRMTPAQAAPLKVEEVCLPFVLVRSAQGRHTMIDVRRVRLARVSQRFGRAAFRRMRGTKPESADESL
jgi:hypothetical protein